MHRPLAVIVLATSCATARSQGFNVESINGVTFGDGVRCTGGSLVRIGQKLSVGGRAQYPEAGDLPISVKGLVGTLGGLRTYQVAYRNVVNYCTAATIDFTNGAAVFWRP